MGDFGTPFPSDLSSSQSTLPVPNPSQSFWQTSHPNPLVNHRTTASLPPSADIVVIGSGITAAFAVRELLSRRPDLKVAVLEARTTCSGATGRNGGHCQPIVHETTPPIVDFELINFQRVEQLVKAENVKCDWRRLEGCMGFWNKEYFEEAKEELERQKRDDPRHTELERVVDEGDDGKGKGDSLGGLRLRRAKGAILQEVAATLSPYKLIVHLWSHMLSKHQSLNLQTTTPITNIETVTNSAATKTYAANTPRGTIHAPHILLATNGYTSHLLPQFSKLIRPVQGQMSALQPPPSFKQGLLEKSYGFIGTGEKNRIMSDYLHQRPLNPSPEAEGGELMFGGARECAANQGEGVSDDSYVDSDVEKCLTGLPKYLDLKSRGVAADSLSYPIIADTNSISPTHLDLVASWTGIMGYSIDHHPWVGGVPQQEGLWLCAGYTGHGMTNASGCGEHVARLVLAAMAAKEESGWKEVEKSAIEQRMIPKEYVLTEERMRQNGI